MRNKEEKEFKAGHFYRVMPEHIKRVKTSPWHKAYDGGPHKVTDSYGSVVDFEDISGSYCYMRDFFEEVIYEK